MEGRHVANVTEAMGRNDCTGCMDSVEVSKGTFPLSGVRQPKLKGAL